MQYHDGRLIDQVHIELKGQDYSRRFYGAVLAAAGSAFCDDGDGYYAALLFEPDDNNIEAVFHGPAERGGDNAG